ncbi:ATP-dependent RNA helicase DEAH13-like [Brassica napus]|uniref:ATP-dependent RNA helicase DEAH13-like n=1 Tax=Brassica napus TaxID=3708 RepID=UPI00207B0647|nr:ATP-dependent RNA helicase DEAH13-like [Brassica napus]XP_048610934.1 ATP-dependent RNA helicase DEAH13-like [Brassica napus]
MKGDDSILDLMPPRKKHNKGPNKKRKLKKLEEDREKELLSAKTSKLLDKYKISQDVSSLFQSSKAIGRSDKKLEKRMRPMQLSKAGVLSDEPVKENDNSDSCMDEPTTPEIHIPTLHTDSHQLIHPNELDSKVMIISAEESREEECSFMKLVLVQSKLILEVGLLVLHSHVVLLSVLATAERVAHELGVHLSQGVGFKVIAGSIDFKRSLSYRGILHTPTSHPPTYLAS